LRVLCFFFCLAAGIINTPMTNGTHDFLKRLHPVGRIGEVKDSSMQFVLDGTRRSRRVKDICTFDGGAHRRQMVTGGAEKK